MGFMLVQLGSPPAAPALEQLNLTGHILLTQGVEVELCQRFPHATSSFFRHFMARLSYPCAVGLCKPLVQALPLSRHLHNAV